MRRIILCLNLLFILAFISFPALIKINHYEASEISKEHIHSDAEQKTVDNNVYGSKEIKVHGESSSNSTLLKSTESIYEYSGKNYRNSVKSVQLISVKFSMYFKDEDKGLFDKGKDGWDKDVFLDLRSKDYIITSSEEKINGFYFHHGSNCYNKKTYIKSWYDNEGKINVRENDRNTGYHSKNDHSVVDFHQTLDSNERLKAELRKTEYIFEVQYDDIYDISKDEFGGSYREATEVNLSPLSVPIFTYEMRYSDLEERIRWSLKSKYITSNDPDIADPDGDYLKESDGIGMKFYSDSSGDHEISKNQPLTSHEIYVKFYSNGLLENVYGDSGILTYEIPYIKGFYYEGSTLENGYPEYNSFNNPSSTLFTGGVKNNNATLYLNTGGTLGINEDSENIVSVEYSKNGGDFKKVELKDNFYRVNFEEEGSYKVRINTTYEFHDKKEITGKGDSDTSWVIDVLFKDGQSFFDNNDLITASGDYIDHEYALYENELYEYYESNDGIKMKIDSSNSNFLFSEDFLLNEENYNGNLYKCEGIGVWTEKAITTDIATPNEITILNPEDEGLYKYVLKDVFGFEYTYYFKNTLEDSTEEEYYTFENYLKTEEGMDLQSYLQFNYSSEFPDKEAIQNKLSYLQLEKYREELVGKKNLKYYTPSQQYISQFVDRIEYGSSSAEIQEQIVNGIIKDMTVNYDEHTVYVPDSFTVTPKEGESNITITDDVVLHFNIRGKLNSETYGEKNIEYRPLVFKNLSKLKIDANALTDLTYRENQDVSFKYNIAPKLQAELFSQIQENPENNYYGINESTDKNHDGISDIKIIWYLPPMSEDQIIWGQDVRFKIISTNEDDFRYEYNGHFISHTRYNLETLFINSEALSVETLLFKSGTKFGDVRQNLEQNIINQTKLVNFVLPTEFKFEWSINGNAANDETILNKEDIIEAKISSSYDKFSSIKKVEFESLQYINISDITLDTQELQEYINSKYEGINFGSIKSELEIMIYDQISEQIGNKYSSFIDIEWFIGDEEIMEEGKVINFKLSSNSKLRVHDSENHYSIQFHEKESGFTISFMDFLAIVIILTALLVIMAIVYKIFL